MGKRCKHRKPRGNPALFDSALFLTGPSHKVTRWRVDFYGLGTLTYCPSVRRTPEIDGRSQPRSATPSTGAMYANGNAIRILAARRECDAGIAAPAGLEHQSHVQLLQRSPSTVSRKLQRNADGGNYASTFAQRKCQQWRSRPGLCPSCTAAGHCGFLSPPSCAGWGCLSRFDSGTRTKPP